MSKVIGQAISRKDGRAKVTGTATYAAEHQIPGLVHGYLVTASIASGRIQQIDTSAAKQAPGAIAVFTHQNVPQISKPQTGMLYEQRLPLADDRVYYGGQIIALVVAQTFEQARDAAHLIQVKYENTTALVDAQQAIFEDVKSFMGEALQLEQVAVGDFAAALASATTKIEATYTTPTELHAPMEPHAIIAHWQGSDSLTIYEPSQALALMQYTYAQLFGIPQEQVRVISPYIGGAFGSKAFPWPHAILCAVAARELQCPLKLVLSRRQMTANTGHRSETVQTISLGADAGGKLIAIDHVAKSCTSLVTAFPEPCVLITPAMYAAPNLRVKQQLATMNVGSPTFMRAPGENPGMWALESAMDELAWALNIDPVELRLKNETQQHQSKKLPFSAKSFADCLTVGSAQFGWQNRPQPRSLTRGGKLVGWGMAAATFPGYRGQASAQVRLLANGTAQVLTSGNDMGTGAYTIIAATAADMLGLPVEQVHVQLGDSLLPNGGMAGGSMMTASLAPSVMAACQEVLKIANVTTASEAFAALRQSGLPAFEATATTAPGAETKQWAFQSWGAHFCEVSVDEEIGRLQVTRWVSVMNIGQVMNAKTAASQVRGGVIMGIGQALMEECNYDPHIGYPVVYDLATYHFPVHADIPQIGVTFVGEPDFNFNPAGARGVGEIGITGVAAAIANATYHATGKRERTLPITPDKLIGS
ncbi:MAG: xanthine dehydrogenase family protein molybdopterin-binding subunit [Goleter apudmare HA4340-LM2]|jgi:xanthine dehydrogenase YagR molybdenum-binding subunit|nr:xanthine dehydrogenase family protein molybdopterin-binding subunit [Goleter apudmare HA4340-LM2]